MDGAVPLTRGPRHDRDTGIQQVVAGKLQIGMTAAEHLGKQFLQATVDAVEVFLEARPGFPVDLADGVFQGVERVFQVRVLAVQVVLALGLLLVFVDGRQVDLAQP